jgi:hypothetical protein
LANDKKLLLRQITREAIFLDTIRAMKIQMTKAKFGRFAFICVLIVGVPIVLCEIWLPAFLNSLYRFEIIGPMVIENVSISMTEGWYPMVYSETWFGHLISKSGVTPTLVLGKASWASIGNQNILTINRTSEKGAEALSKATEAHPDIEQFPWGTVRYVANRNGAFLPSYKLFLTARDPGPKKLREALGEIKTIENRGRSGTEPEK